MDGLASVLHQSQLSGPPILHSNLGSFTVKIDTKIDTTEKETSDEEHDVKLKKSFQRLHKKYFEHCLETKTSIQLLQGVVHLRDPAPPP